MSAFQVLRKRINFFYLSCDLAHFDNLCHHIHGHYVDFIKVKLSLCSPKTVYTEIHETAPANDISIKSILVRTLYLEYAKTLFSQNLPIITILKIPFKIHYESTFLKNLPRPKQTGFNNLNFSFNKN
jgi:hypothetical protein